MSAPTLEKGPYIFNVNNLFVESDGTNKCKRELLELKNCLVDLGGTDAIWTVIASCDATDYVNIQDLDEEHDLWDSIADVNNGYIGNAHSWCILKNKTTNGQLLIDYIRNTPTVYPHYAEIRYSPGGTFADDGTTLAAPTSTDAAAIWWRDYTFSDSSYYSNMNKVVINVMTSADHKITRWYNHNRRSGTGLRGGSIGLIEEVQNTPSEWNSTIKTAVMVNRDGCVSAYIPYDMSPTLGQVDDGDAFYVRYETAEPYASWLTTYPVMECHSGLDGNYGRPIHRTNRCRTGGGYPVCPIGLFRAGNPKGGYLGRLTDIYIGQHSHYSLDTFPADGSRTWIKWGCFMVPWDGSVPVDAY
jgi:hypothetical protein